MSLVSSHINMPASNMLHTLVPADSSLGRKRYLEDLEALDHSDAKRSRTAPPSPPLTTASVLRGRSLSPTPPSSKLPLSPPHVHSSVITPESPLTQLAQPAQIEKVTPVLSVSTTSDFKQPASSPIQPHLPPVSSLTESLRTPTQDRLKLPSLKYLTKNDRYGGTSRYSLDYPDTCVNDDDWRLNLEFWIEKNFPEKFHNLKNLLRYDKPGFELLNDAIFLTELKEQLDEERKGVKPRFNSRISTKMQSAEPHTYYRAHSDDEHGPSYAQKAVPQSQQHPHHHPHHSSSPIASSSQLHTSQAPYTSNYTYSTQTPSTPTKKPPKKTTTTPQRWTGHHKLNDPVVLSTSSFIHSQTHKGPNHTYTIHHANQYKRVCISCGTDQSPCWRPSWSTQAGQLCNSCGLRYKKTGARCVEKNCFRIPAKGEWLAMENRGKVEITKKDGTKVVAYKCLHCGGEVEVKEKDGTKK